MKLIRKIKRYFNDPTFSANGRGRMRRWVASSSGPNTTIVYSLSELRSKSRDLTRNFAYMNGAYETVSSNIVGSGINVLPRHEDCAFCDRIIQLWDEWQNDCDISGVNNLQVDNILSKRSDERFGFTESDVQTVLRYYGHPEKMDEVRDWYDGYRFGDAEVYNPFSVMNYVSSGFLPQPYWANSGNDRPMRWMMERTDSRNVDAVADIVSGQHADADLHMDMTYEDMRTAKDSDLYSLMVMTGYLNAVPGEDGGFRVSVPNKEVMGMVDKVLKDTVPVDDSLFREFAAATMNGDAATMESILSRLLEGTSYFDLKDESEYKLAVFLCLHGIIWRYDVECERQRGNGRLDIMMRPRDGSVKPVIMELKLSSSDESLDKDADDAIRQIRDRRYYNGMAGEVLLYGIAFHGVIPRVVSEMLSL